ncbi:hypothetical protein HW115_10580 [Verrucomicrobiaceae bacterium N1E253]|uniref:Uncharacterized protein n=1 Tax=Oceaniferula marina TaxID=2748318 RepID=A0A851GE65_9BACT|nr:hypothetical protein [Oceaniferula marina]NWK56058.1 hypothetical protein [Oceaniferula marina]
MKPSNFLITLGLLATPVLGAEPATSPSDAANQPGDMIRFSNEDTLHGEFRSFAGKDSLTWSSPESKEPITFQTKKLHRIVLNNGQARQSLKHTSAIHLINGDVIPGLITEVNESLVKIQTEHLGNIDVPRDTVSHLTPSPFGGKLLYYGPLSTEGWKTMAPTQDKKKEKDEEKAEKPAQENEAAKPQNEADAKAKEEKEKKQATWQHVANAWYAGKDKSIYLVRENALPDRCKLSFDLAWQGSLYANVVLHADFAPPEAKEQEEEHKHSRSYNNTPGHCYILNVTSHSATLSSITYDDNGKPHSNRFDDTRASLGLSGKEHTSIELRIDRPQKSILLFSDGQFRCKWDLGETYDGKGNHLAFRNLGYNHAKLRVSNIAISHWNGMKDSAQSMSHSKRDVILLNNGLDRFSGTLKHLRNQQVSFVGSYDSELTIPLEEVQEIHLASNGQKKSEADTARHVYFYIYPYGRISGTPSQSQNGTTSISNDLLGELKLNTNYVNIIDFSHNNSLLDLWDDNF